MASTPPIENLSPIQIYDLAQTTRAKLSLLKAQEDRNLLRVIGSAMLLNVLEFELTHAKPRRLQNGCARYGIVPLRREMSLDTPRVTITVVEVTEGSTLVSEKVERGSRTP